MREILKKVFPYLLVIVLVDYSVLGWNYLGAGVDIWPVEGILIFPMIYFLLSLLCALKNGWIPQFPFVATLLFVPGVCMSRGSYAIGSLMCCLVLSCFAMIIGSYFYKRTYE